MQKGEIWVAVWPNDPHKKPRPLLVVSNDYRNAQPNILDVVVCKLTSLERADGTKKPVNQAEDMLITLLKKTIIRCGSLYSIPKTLLNRRLRLLDPPQIAGVNECLMTVLDLH